MKSTAVSSLIGLSAALLMVGCASSDYEDTDYAITETTRTSDTTMVEPRGTEIVEASGAEPTPAPSGNEWVIPLHEEKLNVEKRVVDSGEVTIRKVVISEPVSQPVDLRKETLIIEREPAGAPRPGVSTYPTVGAPGLFEEDTVTIQLQEEQPVVEKTTVQIGQVTARKNTQWDTREVQGEIRREDVRVERAGNTADVIFEGDSQNTELSSPEIEEAAGAKRPDRFEEPRDY